MFISGILEKNTFFCQNDLIWAETRCSIQINLFRTNIQFRTKFGFLNGSIMVFGVSALNLFRFSRVPPPTLGAPPATAAPPTLTA